MDVTTRADNLAQAAALEANAEQVDEELARSLEMNDPNRSRKLETQAAKLRHLAAQEVREWDIKRQLGW